MFCLLFKFGVFESFFNDLILKKMRYKMTKPSLYSVKEFDNENDFIIKTCISKGF